MDKFPLPQIPMPPIGTSPTIQMAVDSMISSLRHVIFNDEVLKEKFRNELKESIFNDEALKERFIGELRESIFTLASLRQKIQNEHAMVNTQNHQIIPVIPVIPPLPTIPQKQDQEEYIPLFDESIDKLLADGKEKSRKTAREYPDSIDKPLTDGKEKSRTKATDKPLTKQNKKSKISRLVRNISFCGDEKCDCVYFGSSDDLKNVSKYKLYVTKLPINEHVLTIREELGKLLDSAGYFPEKTYVGRDNNKTYAIIKFKSHSHSQTIEAYKYLDQLKFYDSHLRVNFFKK